MWPLRRSSTESSRMSRWRAAGGLCLLTVSAVHARQGQLTAITIVDPAGRPLANLEVSLYSDGLTVELGRRRVFTTRTDDQGRAVVSSPNSPHGPVLISGPHIALTAAMLDGADRSLVVPNGHDVQFKVVGNKDRAGSDVRIIRRLTSGLQVEVRGDAGVLTGLPDGVTTRVEVIYGTRTVLESIPTGESAVVFH